MVYHKSRKVSLPYPARYTSGCLTYHVRAEHEHFNHLVSILFLYYLSRLENSSYCISLCSTLHRQLLVCDLIPSAIRTSSSAKLTWHRTHTIVLAAKMDVAEYVDRCPAYAVSMTPLLPPMYDQMVLFQSVLSRDSASPRNKDRVRGRQLDYSVDGIFQSTVDSFWSR